jgi:hypothetical protein
MQKWEYMAISVKDGEIQVKGAKFEEGVYLNMVGLVGWELIGVMSGATYSGNLQNLGSELVFGTLYLKRPKP